MFRAALLLLLSCLPIILCSCFTQVPWPTSRHVFRMIDPCFTIDNCQSACLGTSQCLAYAYVNMRCALLGVDSGKAQICTSANPVCYVRTAACDDVTTSTTSAAPATTTTARTTTTTSTTTTTTPTTSTTTTAAVCPKLGHAQPSPCSGCLAGDLCGTQMCCPSGYVMWSWDGSVSSQRGGPLDCRSDGEWFNPSYGSVVPADTQVYCAPR